MKIIKQKIVKWIKQKIKTSHTKGLVLGLSGGIDSAVIAVLAKIAVGTENLMCVVIPCHSQKEDTIDAMRIVTKFKLVNCIYDLTYIYDYMNILLPFNATKTSGGNLKARLRMSVLYSMANQYNYLVCGTGNKTEIAIGYFTKYGDGGVDIEPIGDLYKGDVVKLAKYLGIPKEIINKPPSAGLWIGQTDEKEMGITYEALEKNLEAEYSKDISEKVIYMIENSDHKRSTPPICKIN